MTNSWMVAVLACDDSGRAPRCVTEPTKDDWRGCKPNLRIDLRSNRSWTLHVPAAPLDSSRFRVHDNCFEEKRPSPPPSFPTPMRPGALREIILAFSIISDMAYVLVESRASRVVPGFAGLSHRQPTRPRGEVKLAILGLQHRQQPFADNAREPNVTLPPEKSIIRTDTVLFRRIFGFYAQFFLTMFSLFSSVYLRLTEVGRLRFSSCRTIF